jgi:DNA-binding transcriptional LysR family regulator
MPMLDTDRLGGMRAFVAVATRHSFVAAADELGLSASALSRRIAQLERALGCRLLQRTTRRVALTEAGALYLERCLDVLARADEADAAVSAFSAQPRGLLRVSLPNLYGQLRVAPLLPEFMRRHPLLRLEVTMEDRYIDLVEQRIDVGVRIGDLRSGDYVARRLALNRRRLCASPEYLRRKGTPLKPADLRGHACLQLWHRVARGLRHGRGPGRGPAGRGPGRVARGGQLGLGGVPARALPADEDAGVRRFLERAAGRFEPAARAARHRFRRRFAPVRGATTPWLSVAGSRRGASRAWRRYSPGGIPISRRKARLKANSDS